MTCTKYICGTKCKRVINEEVTQKLDIGHVCVCVYHLH